MTVLVLNESEFAQNFRILSMQKLKHFVDKLFLYFLEDMGRKFMLKRPIC